MRIISARLATRAERRAYEDDGMRDDYEFSKGVRGKYADRFAEGSNVVILEPDVARVFSDSASVKKALLSLAEIAEKQAKERTGPPSVPV